MGYRIDRNRGTIDIGGYNLARTRKFRNVRGNPHVCLVVDDLASVDPRSPATSRDILRITPLWIGSWGLDEDNPGIHVRRATGEPVA
ncbi:hypothetical protein [Prauserella alba]|uniref:Pyridoxamine 5'-phosphate oxidase n=1 Tax=Prauserella alba TaxID=176898 RepID=A0ABN1VCQ9_9PSEU|nr:hypothetical protein [Prauserella alba]